MFILDDILLAPIKGIVWIGQKIEEVVKRETSDKSKIQENLLELQMRLELEEITESEYEKEEKKLLAELNRIQKEEEGE
jgi:hypothetical protein